MGLFNLPFLKNVRLQILVFAIAAITLIGTTSYFYFQSTQAFIQASNQVQASQRIINEINTLLSLLKDAETGERGYVITLQERFLEPYQSAIQQIPAQIERTDSIICDNTSQQRRLSQIKSLIDRQIDTLTHVVQLAHSGQVEQARSVVSSGAGKNLLDKIRILVDSIIVEEQTQLHYLETQVEINSQHTLRVNLLMVAVVATFLLIGLIVILQSIRRRQQLEQELMSVNQELTATNEEMSATLEELNTTNEALNATNEKLNQSNSHLLTLNEQVSIANKELEAFTYSVSHDLRTPLRSVVGFSEILRTEHTAQLDEEAKRLTEIISKNALLLGKLVDDLLEFSRLGRKALVKTSFSMGRLLLPLIEEQKNQYPDKHHIVVINRLPDTLVADPQLIRQVWTNFLSNAFKFSRKRENPYIEISCEELDNEYIFSIQDNGVGFDPQYAHNLFNVFQRLHSSKEFEGTGVGLAIVQRIISSHGGCTWATSAIEQGATFFFTLPKATHD